MQAFDFLALLFKRNRLHKDIMEPGVHRSTPLGDGGTVCTLGDDTDDILA